MVLVGARRSPSGLWAWGRGAHLIPGKGDALLGTPRTLCFLGGRSPSLDVVVSVPSRCHPAWFMVRRTLEGCTKLGLRMASNALQLPKRLVGAQKSPEISPILMQNHTNLSSCCCRPTRTQGLKLAPAELAVVEGSGPTSSTMQLGKGDKNSNKA